MYSFDPKSLRIFQIVFLVLLAPYIHAQSLEEKADELASQFFAESGLPGLAISVSIDGELVWSDGFGYADVEQQVPVSPSLTRFRVGSTAKPMTAMALAYLYEAGMIDLDAPIQDYLPDYPQYEKAITARLLAAHLAGVRHYDSEAEFLSAKPYETVSDGLSIFRDDPLVATPGSEFHYSSYGFNLLSAVIESAAGEDFLSYIDKTVFRPVGMEQTVADDVYSIIPNRSRYYEMEDRDISNSPWVDNSYKWASGGFLSTSEDLVRFGNAHLSDDFLQSETIEMLWTRQTTAAGEETNYGLGWRAGDVSGKRIAGHGGGSVGGTTLLLIFPDDKLVIAVITNTSQAKIFPVLETIVELFLAEELDFE